MRTFSTVLVTGGFAVAGWLLSSFLDSVEKRFDQVDEQFEKVERQLEKLTELLTQRLLK